MESSCEAVKLTVGHGAKGLYFSGVVGHIRDGLARVDSVVAGHPEDVPPPEFHSPG